MNEIVYLIIMSSSSVIVLFIISKLLGKRQISQLEFMDYVLGISIGSIAAEMATDISDKPIYYYIIAMFIFYLLDLIVTFLGRKGTRLKNFLKGRPITIIYDGEIDFPQLKKSKLDVNDLIALCREKGYFDLTQIAYAIFENSGHLSILPKGDFCPVTKQDVSKSSEKSSLGNYLIIDGKISYSCLSALNKDESWLNSKLKLNKKQQKNILLAIYDAKNDKIILHEKLKK